MVAPKQSMSSLNNQQKEAPSGLTCRPALPLSLTFFCPPAALSPLHPSDTGKVIIYLVPSKFLREIWQWKYDKTEA